MYRSEDKVKYASGSNSGLHSHVCGIMNVKNVTTFEICYPLEVALEYGMKNVKNIFLAR